MNLNFEIYDRQWSHSDEQDQITSLSTQCMEKKLPSLENPTRYNKCQTIYDVNDFFDTVKSFSLFLFQ